MVGLPCKNAGLELVGSFPEILEGHGIPAMLAQQIGQLEIKSRSSPVRNFDEVPPGSEGLEPPFHHDWLDWLAVVVLYP